MPVVLVIIILMAWAVILGPSLMKRRSRGSDGTHSISHFHHQLSVLEHSAPEPIVAPAYRLHAVDGADGPRSGIHYRSADGAPVLTVVGAKELPRAALAFLGEPTAPDEPGDDAHGATADGSRSPARSPRSTEGYTRQTARRRRRDTLAVLASLVVVSLLVGLAPGASSAWIVAALSAVTLVVYVALLVRLRQQAEERERKLRYLTPREDAPLRAGGRSVRSGGRHAHPSTGRALAH